MAFIQTGENTVISFSTLVVVRGGSLGILQRLCQCLICPHKIPKMNEMLWSGAFLWRKGAPIKA